jgi:hypothetical protein
MFIIVNVHFLEKGRLCFYYDRTIIFRQNGQWDERYEVAAVNEAKTNEVCKMEKKAFEKVYVLGLSTSFQS